MALTPPIYVKFTLSYRPGSVVSIATGYGLYGPGIESWTRFSAPVQTSPGAHTAVCTMCTRFFPGVKSGQGMMLTLHPLLVSWSCKGRAIPLLPLWGIRPIQSLSACTRVHFTLPFFIYLAAVGRSLKKYIVLQCELSGYGAVPQTGRSLVRSQMVSLEFFIDIILPIALRPWGQFSL